MIDISQYVQLSTGIDAFNNSGAAITNGNNIFSKINIFTDRIMVPAAVNNDDAVNYQQMVDTITASVGDAATVAYVNTALALKLDLAGGTMTGPLILSRDPVDAMEAATKQFAMSVSGGDVFQDKPNVFTELNTFDAGVIVQPATTGSNPLTLTQFTAGTAGLAPIASPMFTGTPQTPTPVVTSNDTSVPNTSWVTTKVAASVFDVTAPHTFTAINTFNVPPVSITNAAVNTTQVPNMSQVQAMVAAVSTGYVTPSSNVTWTGNHTFNNALTLGAGAVLSGGSVQFPLGTYADFLGGRILSNGAPTAPTLIESVAGTSGRWSVQTSTGSSYTLFDSRGGTFAGTISGPDGVNANDYTTLGQVSADVTGALTNYAPLASPTFTGVPRGPLPTSTADPTQLATVQYVINKTGGQMDPTANYTISGSWSFTQPLVVANGTATTNAVNLGQLNTATAGLITQTFADARYYNMTIGGQTIPGPLTLTGGVLTAASGVVAPVQVPFGGSVVWAGSTGGAATMALSMPQVASQPQPLLQLPAITPRLAIVDSNGVSLGTMLTTQTGLSANGNNTWTGTNAFNAQTTFGAQVTATAVITSNSGIVTSDAVGFQGRLQVPNGAAAVFAPATGAASTGASIGVTNANVMTITLPASQSSLQINNNAGGSLGTVLTTQTGPTVGAVNTWTARNTFGAGVNITAGAAMIGSILEFSASGASAQFDPGTSIQMLPGDGSGALISPGANSTLSCTSLSSNAIPNMTFAPQGSPGGSAVSLFPTWQTFTNAFSGTLNASQSGAGFIIAVTGGTYNTVTLPASTAVLPPNWNVRFRLITVNSSGGLILTAGSGVNMYIRGIAQTTYTATQGTTFPASGGEIEIFAAPDINGSLAVAHYVVIRQLL